MSFRSIEKMVIGLVFGAFILICFGTVFFIPDRMNNKVYRVYKKFQASGRDFLIPPVIDKPDVVNSDRDRLMAQIDKDDDSKNVLIKPKVLENKPEIPDAVIQPKELHLKKFKEVGDLSVIEPGSGEDMTVKDKRDFVRNMMKHAWDNYAKYAWGSNELRPISRRGHSASVFGSSPMGASIVDGLDTLYIMGLMDEYKKGRMWVEENLDFDKMIGDISVFETNIRYVGGMLSIYAFTGDSLYKEKAVHIADKLMPAFNTPTGIPHSLINMRTGMSKNFGWASGGASILSEIGTLHMEFAYLSDITGDPKYVNAVKRVRDSIKKAPRSKQLYPNYINPKTGKWGQQHTSVGALGDSFYEYLLKEWLRSGKVDIEAKELFDEAALDIENKLIKISSGGLTYIAEFKYGRLEHKMDHLACFGGGMYALAAKEEKDANSERWMNIGAGITNTCHESYDRTSTKLGPEAFRFTDGAEARALKQNERYYILRPETFESYFVMWRLTHDEKYRQWGWEAIEAIEKNCRSSGGYSGVKNVYQDNGAKDDVQQSFFLAETLKYLYLLFSDDSLVSLDHWVLNTEAHPLPVKGINSNYRAYEETNSHF
ncbi:mannosyl-oligosaccharide 1,2-alpha-mannosidase IA [Lepeophtheirus salmonis]|uniref:alpha-1,2-Mannosidase n=1 Tax=Lepeophtheirus salmonis TaxID=72036 RepID=A0A0K2V928_LEPSM|nr:mannosyl-oligosaccharide alpha-1,2-mannosidase IA-like [Lepeophtheirus salmonis]